MRDAAEMLARDVTDPCMDFFAEVLEKSATTARGDERRAVEWN
jgi:hypothetical protein